MPEKYVYIGAKPLMDYVTTIVMHFTRRNAKNITIKARGKFISKAVDVAEVSTKRFLQQKVRIGAITSDSESFTGKDKREVNVSTISIELDLLKP